MQVEIQQFLHLDAATSWVDQLTPAGTGTVLVQVMAAIEPARVRELARRIRRRLTGARVIGASARLTLAGDQVKSGQILLTVMRFEATRLQCAVQPLSEDLQKSGMALFSPLLKPDTQALIAFADGIGAAEQAFFDSINHAGSPVPVAGGIADPTVAPWVLLDEATYCDAAVAVALQSSLLRCWHDGLVEWFPIGPWHRVTRAEGKRVHTLDEEPAYALYRRYLTEGRTLSFSVAQDFPLQTAEDEGNLLAVPEALYPDDSIDFTEVVPRGARVRFSYSHPSLSQEGIEQSVARLAAKCPQAIFIYNCSARAVLADGNPAVELAPFATIAPTAGMYCFGEFHRAEHQVILHHSLTYLAMTEVSPVTEVRASRPTPHPNPLTPLFSMLRSSLADLDQRTAQLELEVELKTQALLNTYRRDPLTGLPTRLALQEALAQAQPLTELANIKLTNRALVEARFGHLACERLMQCLSRHLASCCNDLLPGQHRLYLTAPDQWMISYRGRTDSRGFEHALQQVIEALEGIPTRLPEVGELEFYATLATGIVRWLPHFEADEFIKLAGDVRLAAEQRRVRLLTAEAPQSLWKVAPAQAEEQLRWYSRVHQGLSQRAIRPFGQVIYSAGDRRPVALECLMRLHDDHGDHLPGQFLPAIMDTRLYGRASRMMLSRCVEQMDPLNIDYSVNLSPGDLLDEQTLRHIGDLLHSADHPHRFCLEIIETEQIQDYRQIRTVLDEFRQLGAKLSIDDFGSGYSNLDELLQLEPDFVKLDGSLVRDVESNRRQRQIAEHMIRLFQSLGVKTVAEFCRTETVCRVMEDLGADFLQGYHLNRPQPLDSQIDLLLY